jgi:stage V sporulation protein R
MKELEKAVKDITNLAVQVGLDPFEMVYELCPADVIYSIGSYGMPFRFTHWSFGKSFHKMKMQYNLGLSKIYELVINTDPCYAYLLDTNSLVQNKMIVAHVLAHSDFFKHNVRFSKTNRNMIHQMEQHAKKIQSFEKLYGKEIVEKTLDAAISIQEHIDYGISHDKKKDILLFLLQNSSVLEECSVKSYKSSMMK